MIIGTIVSIISGTFLGFPGVVVSQDYGNGELPVAGEPGAGTTPVVIKVWGRPVVVNIENDCLAVASKDSTDYKYVEAWWC